MSNRTFMYRRKDGEVEAKVFDSDTIPEGWVDSPAKLTAKPAPNQPKPKGNAK